MKRGIKTIIAGVVLFILGAVVIPVLCILPLILGHSSAPEFKVPGSFDATVDAPGRYYVWNDFRAIFEGKTYNSSTNLPNGISIQVRTADGRALQFVGDTSTSMSTGSSSKNSIGYVEVERPGKVTIQVSGSNEERIFCFAKSELLRMFGQILGGFVLSMLVAVAGIGVIIWGVIKRVQAGRAHS